MPETLTDTLSKENAVLTVAPDSTTVCREADAPWSAHEASMCHTGKIAYIEGVACEPRRELPGYDSGVMTLVLGVFVVITLNLRHYSTFLKTFTHNLFSVRRRQNVFDERSTMSEARVQFSLVLLLCVSEGVLMFSLLNMGNSNIDNFAGVSLLSLLATAFYLVQYAAYWTVGYVFTTPGRRGMWVKGFTSSQALLGLALVVPALLSLFDPASGLWLLSLSGAFYLISRIIFIYKGFRIFYHNSFSLVYFILYLCSLEIIPLILIYKASLFLTSIL